MTAEIYNTHLANTDRANYLTLPANNSSGLEIHIRHRFAALLKPAEVPSKAARLKQAQRYQLPTHNPKVKDT
jgi:hypothetical protein